MAGAVTSLLDSIKLAIQIYPGALRNTTVALIVYGLNEIVESEDFFQCPNKNFALYASCFFVIPALFLIVSTIFLHSGFWKLVRGCCNKKPNTGKDENCWSFLHRRCYALVEILFQSFVSGFLWIFWALLQRKYFTCARLGGSKEAKLINATFEERLKIEADYANTGRNSQIAALLSLGGALIVAFVAVSVYRCRFQPEFGSLPSSFKCETLRAEAAVRAFKENMEQLAQGQGKRRADLYFAKIKEKQKKDDPPDLLKEKELSAELLEEAYENLTTVNEFKEQFPPLEDFKHLQAQAAVTAFKERVQQEGKQKVEQQFMDLTWHGSVTEPSSVDGTQPNTGENVPTESSSRGKSESKVGRGDDIEMEAQN